MVEEQTLVSYGIKIKTDVEGDDEAIKQIQALEQELEKSTVNFEDVTRASQHFSNSLSIIAFGPLKTMVNTLQSGISGLQGLKSGFNSITDLKDKISVYDDANRKLGEYNNLTDTFLAQQSAIPLSARGASSAISMTTGATTGLTGAVSGLVASLGPVVVLITAVAAVAGALYLAWETNFMGIRDIVDSVVGNIMDTLGIVMELITIFSEAFTSAFDEAGVGGVSFAEMIDEYFGDVIDTLIGFMPIVAEVGKVLGGMVVTALPIIEFLINVVTFTTRLQIAFAQLGVAVIGQFVEPVMNALEPVIEVLQFIFEGIVGIFGFLNQGFEQANIAINSTVDAVNGVNGSLNVEQASPAVMSNIATTNDNRRVINANVAVNGVDYSQTNGRRLGNDINEELSRGFENI